jgi:hypothetical protein
MGGDNNQDPFTNKDLWSGARIIFVRIGNFAVNQLPAPELFRQREARLGSCLDAPAGRWSARD